jgi:hypothetical protein
MNAITVLKDGGNKPVVLWYPLRILTLPTNGVQCRLSDSVRFGNIVRC